MVVVMVVTVAVAVTVAVMRVKVMILAIVDNHHKVAAATVPEMTIFCLFYFLK